jgi:hypothetical protein
MALTVEDLTPEERERYDRGEAVFRVIAEGPGFIEYEWVEGLRIVMPPDADKWRTE